MQTYDKPQVKYDWWAVTELFNLIIHPYLILFLGIGAVVTNPTLNPLTIYGYQV